MTAAQHGLRAKSLETLRSASFLHSSLLPNAPPSPGLSSFLDDATPSAFSVVIAGEFNAGKSTFINALIGGEVLKSGPLPTTDALCLISSRGVASGDPGDPGDPSPQLSLFSPPSFTSRSHSSNVDVRHFTLSHIYGKTAHALLSSVTLIDTPGTNAVSELNHDALTKRLLPAADLVLFVTSCDQPLSQSERDLLKLIESWNKKTLVILNKTDVLDSSLQLAQVTDFVTAKVREIFTAEVEVLTVSSRRALAAKVKAGREGLPPDAGVGARDFLESGE